MTGLTERLQAAVDEVKHTHAGESWTSVWGVALDAVVRVVGEEFGEKRDDAPPVHELPTTPGTPIYAVEIRGERFDPPLLAVRVDDPDDDGRPWVTPTRRLPASEEERVAWGLVESGWHTDADITDWVPARVVPADGRSGGPYEALQRIADVAVATGPWPEDDEARQHMGRLAVEALADLDGGDPS